MQNRPKNSSTTKRIDSFLTNTYSTISATQIAIIASISIALLLFLVFVPAGFGVDQIIRHISTPAFLNAVSTIIISIITSLLASIVYGKIMTNNMREDLSFVKSLAPMGYMRSFLHDLVSYRGRYVENYKVDIKLIETYFDDIVLCRQTYSYRTFNRESPIVKFRIARIRSESDRQTVVKEFDRISSAHTYTQYEYLFSLDETSFASVADENVIAEMYRIGDLFVNGQNVELDFSRVGNNMEATLVLDNIVDINEPVEFNYMVEFPIEKESFIAVYCELPTYNVSVSMDYADIGHATDMYFRDFLSTRAPADSSSGSRNILRIQHLDWVIPRSGVQFTWWRRNE